MQAAGFELACLHVYALDRTATKNGYILFRFCSQFKKKMQYSSQWKVRPLWWLPNYTKVQSGIYSVAAKPQNIFDLVHCRPRNSVDSYYLSWPMQPRL